MNETKTILICDDKQNILEVLNDYFEAKGFTVVLSGSGEEALKLVKAELPDIILTDFKLPGFSGIDLIEKIHEIDTNLPVIVITAFGSIPSAVEAMEKGAFNYLTKPLDYELLSLLVERAIAQKDIYQQNTILIEELKGAYGINNLIGKSPGMVHLNKMITTIAGSSTNVLIEGESGTGKELIAKTIHFTSPRRDKPLIIVDCTALPDNLLESELFGYEKGSFTGASKKKKGRIETANGGTLFLDEIGDMNLPLQAKLLRVIQEKEFYPVGGLEPVKVNFRLIAATNKDLKVEMEIGNFRNDLYYRLNVVKLSAPPLRDRQDDIPLLVDHFVDKICRRDGLQKKQIHRRIITELLTYNWPGNVRELENCVERMILFSNKGPITKSYLPTKNLSNEIEKETNNRFQLDIIEKETIISALDESGWNKVKAARLLHIGRKALYNKMKKLQIESE